MINITDNFRVNKPAPIDDRLGPFVSTASALSSIEIDRRHIGLTVIVDDGTGSVEYWFKDGVSNGDLELKATGGGAQVNSDWNATSGVAEILNKPTIPSIDGLVPYTGATQDVDLGTHDLYTNKVYLLDEPNENHASIHYTDGDFHIEDADGHKLLVIEDGFIQLHLTDTIQSNLFTSDLTETRDHFLPDQSGTIALTSDITKSAVGLGNVDNTSDLNKPVSNATQTALNGKENTITAGTTSQYYRGDKTFQPLPKVTFPTLHFSGSTLAGNFGNGVEGVIQTLSIPANTLASGDIIRLGFMYSFSGNVGTKSPRIRFGSNTTTGNSIYIPASLGATVTNIQGELFMIVTSSTNLRIWSTATVAGFGTTTSALTNNTIDLTQPIPFSFNVNKATGADTAILELVFIEILKP